MVPTAIHSAELDAICRKYSVRDLFLFGSRGRGDARTDSDIDMLVSFPQRVSFLRMVALERELAQLFGREVDLQTKAGLSPYIRDRVLKERQEVYAAR